MAKLPKNFPEYSIMYKTLIKKIQDLEKEKLFIKDSESLKENQKRIIQFQKEIEKIKSMFPESFFEN
ncbi:MAG: hypothetical protein R3237_02490 [Nitrosopumilaceae archaeon]|nr:hypothetical protein [Nitrosopumilaceae archaeon]